MFYDSLKYDYPSKRNVVYAKNGMVATSHPLAAEAGLEILRRGGNAIDAAIATAACLTVVEPTSNGIGGDAFAIIWVKDKMYGLNSSGPAPMELSIDALLKKGINEIPRFGWTPITVPGIPGAWAALNERFGKLPLIEVLSPAIRYAEEGYPISPGVYGAWEKAFKIYKKYLSEEQFKNWCSTFAPMGAVPRVGEVWSSSFHAKTLRSIGETKARSFYSGELAEKIDYYSRKDGGYIRFEDLNNFKTSFVDPIKINYRGYDIWELPPNGQGMVALMALNIIKGFDFNLNQKETACTYHKQIEALKLAFADGKKYITDSSHMRLSVESLLSEDYGKERRALIGEKALIPEAGSPQRGGTVYLAAADKEGNMVSYIQSNYMGFGSGIVIPETGIAMQNRGHNFSMDPEHENCLKPGKRTYHTIIPGFLTKNGKALGPFGVMGAFMQPQGHLQVVMNMIDFGLNPQAALDAPRWQWIDNKTVEVEHSFSVHIARELMEMGHEIRYVVDSSGFGRGQIILRNEAGVFVGGTEPRTDGSIAAW